jgi:transcriptional regulator
MARANPQWQGFGEAQPVLAIFHGPHAYVSPSWYRATGVPTWNYAVVHVYGRARPIEDQATLRSLIERLTALHEARNPSPWRNDLPDDRYHDLLGKIVGFEIDIERMEAKFKLSQNRSDADRQGVIAGLRGTGRSSDAVLAELMTSGLPD